MPTMLDVAKHAGVALSTVSYALNGTRPISEETRQRVAMAMEKVGYRPYALARHLANKRSNRCAPRELRQFTQQGLVDGAIVIEGICGSARTGHAADVVGVAPGRARQFWALSSERGDRSVDV